MTIGAEPIKYGLWFGWHHRDKTADRIDDGFDDRNGPRYPGERFAGCKQFSFGLARRQRQRRLQGGMKAICARIPCQIAPIRDRLRDAVRKRQVLAAESVIAEQLRAEAIKIGAGRRYVIDRINREACPINRIEPPPPTATALRGA